MTSRQTRITYAISRHKRNFFFILCMSAFALLVLLDNLFIRNIKYSRVASPEQGNIFDIEKYHNKTFTVINIVDGDTLDIKISDNGNEYTRIRLLGIDAPETNTESGPMYFSQQATEYAKNLILGKDVCIYLDEGNNTRGKYGRLLAYVQLPNGKYVNEVLLSEGFAYADLRFRHSFYNKYQQLESRTRSGKKGLWQNITPDQMPEWLQERGSVLR
jgi:endonuclease YncB( thermonuclease family)